MNETKTYELDFGEVKVTVTVTIAGSLFDLPTNGRRDAFWDLIDTFRGVLVVPAVTPAARPPEAQPRKAKPTRVSKTTAAGDAPPYVCEQCARTFPSPQGLSVHKARAHGPGWSTKPAASNGHKPEPEKFSSSSTFKCKTCGDLVRADRVRTHALAIHGRDASPAELADAAAGGS